MARTTSLGPMESDWTAPRGGQRDQPGPGSIGSATPCHLTVLREAHRDKKNSVIGQGSKMQSSRVGET